MPVPSSISDLSSTASSNYPSGSESIGTSLDDYLRAHASIIKQVSDAKADSSTAVTLTGTQTVQNKTLDGTNNLSGNLSLTGTGARITGDFSNATVANRVMFQSSTVNGVTVIGALPNGTGGASYVSVLNGTDTANSAYCYMGVNSAEFTLSANKVGTGTYLPMTFYTGGSESFRCATDGSLTVSKAAGLGYGTGAGGQVTQVTSKSTAVTLNKPTGQITMHNAALGVNSRVTFDFNNSLISVADSICVSIKTGTTKGAYFLSVDNVQSGVCSITIWNVSVGSLSEAVVINFAIIKGATS